MNYKIAVILTCFNRREKTLACLEKLFQVCPQSVELSTFLTDDGCTDGTADAIREQFADRDITILQGTGSLYWAGGMRLAWNEALVKGKLWDYYLLLNDDTIVFPNVFEELFQAHELAVSKYQKAGIYSGVTCEPSDHDRISYGGDAYLTDSHTKWRRVNPNGEPQMVDRTNANILLVSRDVVDCIGIFYDGYIHGAADEDYAIMARRAGFPVLITGHACGECAYDHASDREECQKLMAMTLSQRIQYLSNPTRSDHDYLVLMQRMSLRRYVVSWVLRKVRLFVPSIYFSINKLRGIY